MNRKNSEDEMPSIIQEIVFYDKPNIKTVVPETIFPKSTVPMGKGDIVISRIRKPESQRITGEHQSEEAKLPESNQESEISVEKDSVETLNKNEFIQSKAPSSIDSLNHFASYENLEEEPLDPENPVESVEPDRTDKHQKASKTVDIPDINKDTTKSPKKQTKSPKKASKVEKQSKESNDGGKKFTGNEKIPIQSKKNTKIFNVDNNSGKGTKKTTPAKVKVSPFKTPQRPVKKGEKKLSQRITMLNYITTKSKDEETKSPTKKSPTEKAPKKSERVVRSQEKSDKMKKEKSGDSAEAKKTLSSPKKKNAELKRSRGRPRKTSASEAEAEKYYSDEDVSFKSPKKSKNYAELTNVPLDSNKSLSENEVVLNPEDLEEILGETQEHAKELERVEKDLQNMFGTGQEGEKKQVGKDKRKSSGKKSKTSVRTNKKVKEEVEEGEKDELVRDAVVVEEYDDDEEEDSRDEWIPLEYAKYKQQHVMRNQSKTFPCKFCGEQFSSYYAMRKHRALSHNDVGKDRKEGTYKESVKCKRENEEDESDEESREEWLPQDYADYKLKHKMTQYQMKRVQWYKCKICCAVFSNYYKLSKHRVEHENKPNPYECKQCDGRFKDVETLMAHIRVHQGKDPYQCRKCEKGFMTKAELDEHVPVHILKRGPTPPKRFRCDICCKEFSKLCDIERHTRVHTGEKPAECNICHKRFQQSHNLSKHLLTHLHVRPFQCEICNKKFGRIDVLNRHLLTHSMEKPFKCEICNKGFIRQVQVTNHMEKVHVKVLKGAAEAKDSVNFKETAVSEDNGEDDHMEDDPLEESEDEEGI